MSAGCPLQKANESRRRAWRELQKIRALLALHVTLAPVTKPPNFETEGEAIRAGIATLLRSSDHQMDELRRAVESFRTAALSGVTPQNALQELNTALRRSFGPASTSPTARR